MTASTGMPRGMPARVWGTLPGASGRNGLPPGRRYVWRRGEADASVGWVLARAAAVISRNGWFQGAWADTGTDCPAGAEPVCAGAAIRLAAGAERPELGSADAAAAETWFARWLLAGAAVVPDPVPRDPVSVIAAWNDAPARTSEQVTVMLRRAAAAWQRQAADGLPPACRC